MADQTAGNVLAAIKRESPAGTIAAAGSGAQQFRLVDSEGLTTAFTEIANNERRIDLVRPMHRNGSVGITGNFVEQLTVGGTTDMLIESIQRRVWTAPVAIAAAQMAASNFATTTSTIVATAGSWITAGVRVGDLVTISGDTTTANNIPRLRVVSVTALVLTVAGTPLTLNATPRAFTVTIAKKITTVGSVVRYSHTIEQYEGDMDLSELFWGCKLTTLAIAIRPNNNVTLTYTFMGIDGRTTTTIEAPYFTSPAVTTGEPMIAEDSSIRFGSGSDVITFTSMDLTIAIDAAGTPVVGSRRTPGIYDNDVTITGNISALRQDLARIEQYRNETTFELSALFSEPGTSTPLGAFGFYLPQVKFATGGAPFRGGTGPKIESFRFTAGPRVAATGYDGSAINFFSTGA